MDLHRFARRGSDAGEGAEDASQSRSQVRPRPAIRLDASLSFLGADSHSRHASPMVSPGLSALPMFATRDINVDAGVQNHSKPSSQRSVPSKSCSVSCGGSRSHPRSQPTARHRTLSIFSTLDVVLDAEPTMMSMPSATQGETEEPALISGCEGFAFPSQSLQRGSPSPAPRLAVTLPDDFEGSFQAVAATVIEEGDATSNAQQLEAQGTVEEGEEEAQFMMESRTWSTTPPPRRAFVLSRRSSVAVVSDNEEEDVKKDETHQPPVEKKEAVVTATSEAGHDGHRPSVPIFQERSAPTHGQAAHHLLPRVNDAHDDEDTPTVVPITEGLEYEAPDSSCRGNGGEALVGARGSALLVMGSAFTTGEKTNVPDFFFAGYRRGMHVRAGHHRPSRSASAHAVAASPFSNSQSCATPLTTETVTAIVTGQTSGATLTVQPQKLTALHGDILCESPEVPSTATTAAAMVKAACASLEVQLSVYEPGRDSASMSPLPRPVQPPLPLLSSTAAHDAAIIVAPRADLPISPAPTRNDTASSSLPTRSAETTAHAAGGAVSNAPDTAPASMCFSMYSATNTARNTLAETREEIEEEQVLVPVRAEDPIQEEAGVSAEEGSTTAAPLDSTLLLPQDSTAIISLNEGLDTTVNSSLWLVSGSTPTPPRRLRRELSLTVESEDAAEPHALSATLDLEECESSGASMGKKREEEEEEQRKGDGPREVEMSPMREELETIAVPANITAATRDSPCCLFADSLSPDPERPSPVSFPSTTTAAVAPASVLLPLTASISPLTVKEQETRTHRCAEKVPLNSEHDTHTNMIVVHEVRTEPHSTPSSFASESTSMCRGDAARVSEEVRELVERAQAEVRRTRESLLASVQRNRRSFHLIDVITGDDENDDEASNLNGETTPTRALKLPAPEGLSPPSVAEEQHGTTPVTESRAHPNHSTTASLSAVVDMESLVESLSRPRTSGEMRSAAVALRPRLAEVADAIDRRLRGYDVRDHGVLSMETVVRVTYYVVVRRAMPVRAWAQPSAQGLGGGTPMRASMGQRSPTTEHRRMRLLNGTPLGLPFGFGAERTPGAATCATPQARPGWTAEDFVRRHSQTPMSMRPLRYNKSTLPSIGVTPTLSAQKRTRSGEATYDHLLVSGDTFTSNSALQVVKEPDTRSSPSRTLEQVEAQQRHRAEGARCLNFYFAILEAFKQVFGERYAWRHLGATNASRQDSTVPKRHRTETAGTSTAVAVQFTRDVVGELNPLDDIAAPLETVFPRLRQQYALRHAEGEATEGLASPALRPPPLDVLVYYHTFTESLREL